MEETEKKFLSKKAKHIQNDFRRGLWKTKIAKHVKYLTKGKDGGGVYYFFTSTQHTRQKGAVVINP